MCRFPLTTIPVATQFEELVPSRQLPVSIVQVAVAIYSGNENIPKDLMRLVLLPGVLRPARSRTFTESSNNTL